MANASHVVTGKVRLSYCNLLEPHASQFGGDPKYSVTVLVPKSDVGTKAKIDAAIEAATVAGTTSKWEGRRPAMVKNPVHDGDGTRPSDGEPFGEECRGCWVFTASCKNKPRIVDAMLNDILDATEIYSGIYGRVGVDFFPYASAGSKGIGCALVNVQKLADGEALAGQRASADEDFGDGFGAAYSAQNGGFTPVPDYPQGELPFGQPTGYTTQPAYPQPVQQRFNPMTGRYE